MADDYQGRGLATILLGPNCIGILNTDPDVRLDVTFGPRVPPPGRVGFGSLSGALGLAAIDEARRRGIGISSFVSMGNKADVSSNDLLSYWESDSRTDVILLYLESFGNPRKFGRIARRVGRTKPIVVVKSGRSTAGARATASRTGALVAASDVTVDALFRQAGVIRADTVADLFDVAAFLATQPVPAGRRVGIVTNVGGPAILCADTGEAEGLSVPTLADETQARLERGGTTDPDKTGHPADPRRPSLTYDPGAAATPGVVGIGRTSCARATKPHHASRRSWSSTTAASEC
jgi:acetate---CoA ligase (ADP-forming)